jgi:predicted RNase H-like HicB family nuclease
LYAVLRTKRLKAGRQLREGLWVAKRQRLHIDIHGEHGSIWATVTEFPGVLATGDDLDELRQSLDEGIALVLAAPGQDLSSVELAPLNAEPTATKVSAELVYA